ncbi:WD40-repeat-containing domain protein [Dichomitus squalens]|uniref:WD40-repeat-containing domain protein n=1 Tax=Dichomitus squalens TaxID=114155 RepID=A0A4V2K6U5_9APHY|nr:WD40-repeat-containing domain protein [Dichomitus squalens]
MLIYPDAGHMDTISALAFSRDDISFASASHDEVVIIWAVASDRKQMRIRPGHAIHSLAYTPDGRFLIAGASDGTLHLWDAQTYKPIRTLRKTFAAVKFILFLPDGSLMTTGSTEGVCDVWETAKLEARKPLSVLRGHRGAICAAAFPLDHWRIITASDDGSSRIWNAETGEALVILHEYTGPIWTVTFSSDDKHIASRSSDTTEKVCNSYARGEQDSLNRHDSMLNAVEFSPHGKFIASAGSDNTVRQWKASDRLKYTAYSEHKVNANAASGEYSINCMHTYWGSTILASRLY